jgi:hypothetical protein
MLEQEDRLLRSDLYELENRLDDIEAQIAQLPTQAYLCRTLLLAIVSTWALLGIVLLVR